mmetsp:Transcript_103067/g.295639  ORF Transcript_103067/g.295639 Transcript_103067/m.295639 type:complete len:201 (-) Transcript_103067:270-872(-)
MPGGLGCCGLRLQGMGCPLPVPFPRPPSRPPARTHTTTSLLHQWLDWNISMSCKMGAEYLRGGNDCCDEGNCPRGSDYDDYFYDGSGNCVNGAGWICAGIESDCSGYQGVFEDQFYTLANVFELDTSSASYSSTWAPTGSPTPVPTPGPTPLPTTPVPTAIPTPQPTPLPTPLPTSAPSFAPTPLPTSAPTLAPTNSTRR